GASPAGARDGVAAKGARMERDDPRQHDRHDAVLVAHDRVPDRDLAPVAARPRTRVQRRTLVARTIRVDRSTGGDPGRLGDGVWSFRAAVETSRLMDRSAAT